jgi:hypothetical protein
MGLLGVARANTAIGASPETFLLLHPFCVWQLEVISPLSFSNFSCVPGDRKVLTDVKIAYPFDAGNDWATAWER